MEKIDFQQETIKLGFSYRAVALIIKDHKLLVAKHVDHDCYYTVGGRVRLHETSKDAVIREAFEETGYHFEIERLAFVQERFTTYYDKKHHEIVFFYIMKDNNNAIIQDGISTDQKGKETLHWINLDDLPKTNVVPEFIKSSLIDISENITHIITEE